MKPDTRLVHAGRDPDRNFGIVNPPVYRASTIVYPPVAEFDGRQVRKYTGFGYGLHGTPRGGGGSDHRPGGGFRAARGGAGDPERVTVGERLAGVSRRPS